MKNKLIILEGKQMNLAQEKKEFKKLIDNAKAYYVSAYGHEVDEYTFIPVDQCEITYGFMYKGYQFQFNKHGFYIYDEDGYEFEDWMEYERLEFERKFSNWLILEKMLMERIKIKENK